MGSAAEWTDAARLVTGPVFAYGAIGLAFSILRRWYRTHRGYELAGGVCLILSSGSAWGMARYVGAPEWVISLVAWLGILGAVLVTAEPSRRLLGRRWLVWTSLAVISMTAWHFHAPN